MTRLQLKKNSPELEAPEHHFMFGADLGEVIPEAEPVAAMSFYDHDEALSRLHATIVDFAKPFTHPIPDHGAFVPRPEPTSRKDP